MSEVRCFPEPQWRAIAQVEERTAELGGSVRYLQYTKPLLGGAFSGGALVLGARSEWIHPKHFGPPRLDYIVFEKRSRLVFCWYVPKPEALLAARERILAIGPTYLAEMIGKYTVEADEEDAAREATVAIIKARRVGIPRKLSKRAKAVFAASEGKCHYCATELDLTGKWEIEHKIPRALFGGSEQSNLAAACVPCNRAKRDKTDLEFQAIRQGD